MPVVTEAELANHQLAPVLPQEQPPAAAESQPTPEPLPIRVYDEGELMALYDAGLFTLFRPGSVLSSEVWHDARLPQCVIQAIRDAERSAQRDACEEHTEKGLPAPALPMLITRTWRRRLATILWTGLRVHGLISDESIAILERDVCSNRRRMEQERADSDARAARQREIDEAQAARRKAEDEKAAAEIEEGRRARAAEYDRREAERKAVDEAVARRAIEDRRDAQAAVDSILSAS
ncbi:hypothetical protein RAS1_29020 [Phycisphaerae bacterium RAS1]|nr:hypothetical protein RAS1_29020 [Phycisphaerae bacterium RAS1]